MRLWHLLFGVYLTAMAAALAREPVGRVAVVVFSAGLIECVVGVFALMTMFRTLGEFAEAKGALERAQSLVATVMILLLAAVVMLVVLFLGIGLVGLVVP